MAADFLFDGSQLMIDTDSANDVIQVDRVDIENPFFDFSFLRVEYGHQTEANGVVVDGYRFYAFPSVTSIHFHGNAGNDRFINNTSINSVAYGGAGSDVLWGGSGNDELYGELGNDVIFGWAGNDLLVGAAGNDQLFGGAGADQLHAGTGTDLANGGSGIDELVGRVSGNAYLVHNTLYTISPGLFSSGSLEGIETVSLYGNANDNMIMVQGFKGNVNLHGNSGNDTLVGSSQDDYLYGGAGDDRIFGGLGDDQIVPGDGNDQIHGGGGHDLLVATVTGNIDLNDGELQIFESDQRETDTFDQIEGVMITAMSDVGIRMDASDFTLGSVILIGGSGNDELIGGSQGDQLIGMGGNDLLIGNAGDDVLTGASGNDRLLGGDGADLLSGGSGNDGLYGGLGIDRLFGGEGLDRYLWQSEDVSLGFQEAEDVRIVFTNTTSPTTILYNGNLIVYGPANWSDNDVRTVDEALAVLQERTGNNVLLRTAAGSGFTYERLGASTSSYAAWNRGATQQFADGTFDLGERWVHQVIFHEVGHNWERENPNWEDFKAISGWTLEDMSDNPDYQRGRVGNWYHLADADFARFYGRSNPVEDFATSFAAYFTDSIGERSARANPIPAKMAFIEDFIDDLAVV